MTVLCHNDIELSINETCSSGPCKIADQMPPNHRKASATGLLIACQNEAASKFQPELTLV